MKQLNKVDKSNVVVEVIVFYEVAATTMLQVLQCLIYVIHDK